MALAEGAGFGAEGHRLVLEDTQIGQHEVGPVLVQVAKEQQTQAIAEVHQRQPPDALRHQLGHGAGPAAEGQGRGLLGLQPRQPVFLAPGLGQAIAKAAEQLFLAQQGEEFDQVQFRIGQQPAELHQRTRRGAGAADLAIDQLAGAEHLALAHHQAHQQCPRGQRQLGEGGDEGLLAVVEQIGIAQGDPVQYPLEVVQIVEGIFERSFHAKGANRVAAGYLSSPDRSGQPRCDMRSSRRGHGTSFS